MRNGIVIIMNEPEKVKYKQPDYDGVCNVLDRVIALYEVADKNAVDDILKAVSLPVMVIESEDVEGSSMALFPKEDSE